MSGVWLDGDEVASLRHNVAWLGQIAARSVSDESGAWQSVVSTVERSAAILDAAEARSGEDDARLAAIAASIRPDTLVSLHPDDAMWLVRRARVAAATASTEQEGT
jgi:hypothetical protein